MENTDRLQKYVFEDETIVTNFEKYEDAEEYANEKNGEILEVGFIDGADNPERNPDGHLMESRKTFRVGLDPVYQVLYSDEPKFQEMAQIILENQKEKENDTLPEDWLSDQNNAPGDRIIVVKDGQVNTVTTRERIKYLMRGNVYELAVRLENTTDQI